MFASLCCENRFGRRRQPVYGQRARLRAAVEADAASSAIVTGVTRPVHAVAIQLRSEFEAFGRAGLDAEPATFALLQIDGHIAARWSWHAFTS
jgi:hypothetical protein